MRLFGTNSLNRYFIRKISVGIAALLVLSVAPAQAILSPSTIPAVFSEMLLSPILANPSMILVDAQSGEVIYEKNANSPRKPASTLKIFSAAATILLVKTLISLLPLNADKASNNPLPIASLALSTAIVTLAISPT